MAGVCVCVCFSIVWCVDDDDDDESLYRAWWESYKQQHGKRRRWEKKKGFLLPWRKMFSFRFPCNSVLLLCTHTGTTPIIMMNFHPHQNNFKNTHTHTHTKNIEIITFHFILRISIPFLFFFHFYRWDDAELTVNYIRRESNKMAHPSQRLESFFCLFFQSGKSANFFIKCGLNTKREKFRSQWHTHTHRAV